MNTADRVSLIDALRASVKERQKLIDSLIKDRVFLENENSNLKEELEVLYSE